MRFQTGHCAARGLYNTEREGEAVARGMAGRGHGQQQGLARPWEGGGVFPALPLGEEQGKMGPWLGFGGPPAELRPARGDRSLPGSAKRGVKYPLPARDMVGGRRVVALIPQAADFQGIPLLTPLHLAVPWGRGGDFGFHFGGGKLSQMYRLNSQKAPC